MGSIRARRARRFSFSLVSYSSILGTGIANVIPVFILESTTMKTTILIITLFAATLSAQTLTSTNASKLQEIERSAIAWKRAIAIEEAEYVRVEKDASKRFLIAKGGSGISNTRKPVYGTKKEKLAAVRASIESLKAARAKEMDELAATLE